MSCAKLATLLDQEMLETVRGISIAPRNSPGPQKTGAQVASELGGRYLLRYLLSHQVGAYANGSDRAHWVTPTPYAPKDLVSWLALPAPRQSRTFVMLLDPSKIPSLLGPRWIRFGQGIEYYLPHGFPKAALVVGWEIPIS